MAAGLTRLLRLTLVGALAALPSAAFADGGDYTEIGSALDKDDPFDLHVSLDYGFESRSGGIKREVSGIVNPMLPDRVAIAKDLLYRGTRHVLTPKVRVGVYTDVELSVALPIVIRDSYTLEFDQSANPCVLPPDPGMPTCVNALNSSTVQDGLLPTNGFDADDPGTGFTDPNDPTIFRGTTRKGIDQIYVGAAWAPMNQHRDPTKPTWKIGTELRLAVGDTMEFDRERPDKSTGVGRGLHEVRLWTSMAKRVSWAEPFIEIWWQAPIGTTDDSLFIETGFGEERAQAQQIAGTRFGFEGIAWENAPAEQRIGLEFSANLQAHFEGRDYSPMWEVFAYAGDAENDPNNPLVIDEDPTMPGVQALSHPGVTNIENYMRFAGRFRINAQIGERARFGVGFELQHDTSHMISFADAGQDLPQCTGSVTTHCEAANNDTVERDSEEANPYHVELIDQSGHRYKADESFDYHVLVHAMLLF